jgi:uncharacterized protein (TIGR02246 family)
MVVPALEGWDNFYVIIGSSAAALTGLQFVVIALMADEERIPRDTSALEAFATPTIVHFCAVLLVSAFVSMPHHSVDSLRITLLITGFFGLLYAIWVTIKAVRQKSYTPELEDWLFHSILPILAYAALFICSAMLGGPTHGSLFGVAGSALLLLFIGIHNAWDSAVWMMSMGRTVKDDERQIREVMERWLSATKSGDLETVLSLMAEDVVFLTPNQPPMNKEKFSAGFRSIAGKKFEAKQDVKEIVVNGNLAYCWSYLSLTMDGKTRAGNILSVFRKDGGGWRLSRDANFVA